MSSASTRSEAGTGLHRTAPRWIMAGAILYLAWILEGVLLTTELDPASSYISELSARNQAGSLLYRTTDGLAGATVTVGAFLAAFSPRLRRRLTPEVRPYWRIMWWSLVVFGLSTVADAVFPMECAITGDAACTAAEMASELPWTHQVHTVTSSVATAALLVAVAVAMPVARRAGWHYGVLVIVAGALTLLGSVWLGVEMARPHLPFTPPWDSLIGASQRLQILGASLWLMRISRLLRLFIADSAFAVGSDSMATPSATDATDTTDTANTANTEVTGAGGERADTAPPLVLCAGLGLSSRVWKPMRRFLGDRRVIVAAHGVGRRPVTLEEEVRVLSDTLAAVPAGERVVVVGHSMWGLVAEAWARQHPDRVAGLVLLDSSVEEDPHPHSNRRPVAARSADVADRMRLPRAGRLLRELAGYRGLIADLDTIRTQTPLPPVPVLVVVADRGALRADRSWVQRQQQLASRLRREHPWSDAGVRVEIVVPSSHLVMLDRPATVVALIESAFPSGSVGSPRPRPDVAR